MMIRKTAVVRRPIKRRGLLGSIILSVCVVENEIQCSVVFIEKCVIFLLKLFTRKVVIFILD